MGRKVDKLARHASKLVKYQNANSLVIIRYQIFNRWHLTSLASGNIVPCNNYGGKFRASVHNHLSQWE